MNLSGRKREFYKQHIIAVIGRSETISYRQRGRVVSEAVKVWDYEVTNTKGKVVTNGRTLSESGASYYAQRFVDNLKTRRA
jgi:hypothetical protein